MEKDKLSENDFDIALALSVIGYKNKQKGVLYPIDLFVRELVASKFPDADNIIHKGIKENTNKPMSLTVKENTTKKSKCSPSAIEHSEVGEVGSPCVSRMSPGNSKKSLPKGKGIKAHAQTLSELFGIDYYKDDDNYIKGVRPSSNTKVLANTQVLCYYEISRLLSCYRYLVKHQNSSKNLLLLKLIATTFRRACSKAFGKNKVAFKVLGEIEMSMLEMLNYESHEPGTSQISKFGITIGFYRSILKKVRQSMTKGMFCNVCLWRLRSIISSVSSLIKAAHETGAVSDQMTNPELFESHHFYVIHFNPFKSSDKANLKNKLVLSLECGTLRGGNVYYLIYYHVVLVKLILDLLNEYAKYDENSQVYYQVNSIREQLLASIIIFDEAELVKMYNTLTWGEHCIRGE